MTITIIVIIVIIILFTITRSTDDGVVINEKKEVVNQLARFQSSLEKIDSYHHAVIPPFYRQVSMSMCEYVRRSTCTTIPSYLLSKDRYEYEYE